MTYNAWAMGKPKTKAKSAGKRKPTRLLQARVSPALYDRIQKRADAETISISAYVRRTLHNVVPGGD